MTARMGAGDTAVNLAATGLVLNAWILTGDPRYRDWIEQYVGAWRERAAANDGIMPDNVGPDGVVGSLLDGRWYGGHYGWSWPHGWYSVGSAAAVAALAAATATGDDGYLDLVRPALDTMIDHGKVMAVRRIRLLPGLQVAPAAGRGRDHPDAAGAVPAQRPRLVRLQPDARRRPGGPVAPRQRPGRPAAAGRAAPGRRVRLAHRPLLPQQGGGRPRGALVHVPGRATTRTTRRRSWPPPRPRYATGSPACRPTAAST